MINFNVKRKLFYFSLIRIVTMVILSLPTVIYGLIIFIETLLKKNVVIIAQQQILIYVSAPLLVGTIFFIIFSAFYNNKLRNELIYEFYEIVTLTKLPKDLPKVVYVYTCHNDMIEARVLQNAKQTYKNIEIWISEGSEKEEVITQSKEFAQKNNFKFYAVGHKGSNNKSENLNSFLLNSGATFDYLLITDSDEALTEYFVEDAIKCFYCPKFKHLGYVSALNYAYKTNNAFSNISGSSDILYWYNNDFNKNIKFGFIPNLYSSCCLISKKTLEKNNGLFPSGCLEDVFLESINLRYGSSAVIIPTSPAGQSFDKNIWAYFKRVMRIYDWSVLLNKKEKLKKYNEKYSLWFSGVMSQIFFPIILLVNLSIIAIVIWLLICFNNQVLHNLLFIYTLASTLSIILIRYVCGFVEKQYFHCLGKTGIAYILVQPLFSLAKYPWMIVHWFKALFLNKYSSFGGSNQKSPNQKHPWISALIGLFACSILIVALTLIYVYVIGFNNIYVNLGYIIPMVFISFIWLSLLSSLILHMLGKIKSRKEYNPNNFVYPKEFFNFEKIKNKFLLDHQNNQDYDLSTLMDRNQKNSQ